MSAITKAFGGTGFGGGRSSVTTQIQQWVEANFHGTTIGNYTVYDLTVAPSPQPASTTATPASTTTGSTATAGSATPGSTAPTAGFGGHRTGRHRTATTG